MKQIILLVFLLFSLEIKAFEYCISDNISLNGSAHHIRISDGDNYELEQISKYSYILKVRNPTNKDVDVIIDGVKFLKFIPQSNCEDLSIDI